MAENLRPMHSVVDFLKAKQEDFSFAARQQLYLARFDGGEQYTGSAEQNIRLLRALIDEENNTAPALSRCVIDEKVEAIIVLIGGFGWGSRASAGPPDIWAFEAQREVEKNIIALISTQIPANWDEVPAMADAVKVRIIEDKNRPVVLVGHSFGATGIIKLAEALVGLGISVDLAVAIDAINSSDPAGLFSNTMSPPTSVASLVHIAAGEQNWILDVSGFQTKIAEYRVSGTIHTDIDNVRETHDIIRHLISLLPSQGINHLGLNQTPADYVPVTPPTTTEEFPEVMRASWTHDVSVAIPAIP